MNNVASILLLAFLALTFLQSGYEKIFYWKDNVSWLKEHFAKTILKNQVPLALLHLLVLELISGILCVEAQFNYCLTVVVNLVFTVLYFLVFVC